MSGFLSEKALAHPLVSKALSALRQVPGAADRIAAEVLSEGTREIWRRQGSQTPKELQYTQAKGHICLRRLLGKRCSYNSHQEPPCQPPGSDHPSLWNQAGKPVCFVFQPYSLSGENLAALTDLCRKHNLTMSISGQASWHFPGRTILVELMRNSPKEASPVVPQKPTLTLVELE